MELYFAVGTNTNPYINLACEWELFESNKPDSICLFLWQNFNTVVIGAHQNPYLECNLPNIKRDNVTIARRRTGGGAVYHDEGNLNFSFIASKKNYDVKKQMSVIQKALASFGINTSISGRNDIVYDEKKFSGNAFYNTDKNCLHHGTLLINANFNKLKNYLSPTTEKLAKKGVSSIESRVVNLSAIEPCITVQSIIEPLKNASESVYENECKKLNLNYESDKVAKRVKCWQSDDYIYGTWHDFTPCIKGCFDWGIADIELQISKGIIKEAKIATDSLFPSSVELAKKLLTGKNSIDINNMATNDAIAGDIINLVRGKLCTI